MRAIVSTILTMAVLGATARATGVDEARALWLRGNYDEAVELLEKDDPTEPSVAFWIARCHESRGRLAEALATVQKGLEKTPTSAPLMTLAARLHRDTGRLAEARQWADRAVAADKSYLPARWELVAVLDATGHADDAKGELEFFIDYYNNQQPKDPEVLLAVALGAAEYARRNKLAEEFDFILNTVLADATAAEEGYWPAHWLAGKLLLEKYNKAEAVPELNRALKINPAAVEALVALGVSSLRDFDFPNGYNFAKQALAINPQSVDALCLQADLLVLDDKVADAMKDLQKALEVNPASEEALGRLAACHILQREGKEAAELEERALKINPRPGVFFARMGEILENRRQFSDAEKSLRRAVEYSPHLADPRNLLGMLYMRMGREDDARAVLAEAFELDPFHVRVSNMKKVLKHLEEYQTLVGKHYELKIAGDQDGILGPYMLEYLEQTHAELCQRFGYEPKGLTKIEIMKDHAWFSARVVGLPSIGTVGACTGDVVALASPQSLKSAYNWARVLSHEVTHVITLQQTHYNIPHWYTEALAVMSEGYPRPQVWNDLLSERVPKRELLNLYTINHAFIRPKTPLDWQMAYCQAHLYALYMVDQWGEESLGKMLAAYRDGMPTDVALKAIFNKTKPEFEAGYLQYLDKVVAGLSQAPPRKVVSFAEAEKAYRASPKDADIVADLAVHYMKREKNKRARELAEEAISLKPDHPTALYVLARMEWSIGKTDEALKILQPAIEKNPTDEKLIDLLAALHIEGERFKEAAQLYESAQKRDPNRQKWVEGLVRMYLKLDDKEKLPEALKTLASMDADNLIVRQKLAELAFERQDWKEAAHWARQSMHISVKAVPMHRILAEASVALKDSAAAVREYVVIEKLGGTTTDDSIGLVKAYRSGGQADKAQALLDELIKSHPDDPRVLSLKEEGSP